MSQDRYRQRRGIKMDEYLERGVVIYHDDHVSLRWDIDGVEYGFDIGYTMFDQMRLEGGAPVVMQLLAYTHGPVRERGNPSGVQDDGSLGELCDTDRDRQDGTGPGGSGVVVPSPVERRKE